MSLFNDDPTSQGSHGLGFIFLFTFDCFRTRKAVCLSNRKMQAQQGAVGCCRLIHILTAKCCCELGNQPAALAAFGRHITRTESHCVGLNPLICSLQSKHWSNSKSLRWEFQHWLGILSWDICCKRQAKRAKDFSATLTLHVLAT